MLQHGSTMQLPSSDRHLDSQPVIGCQPKTVFIHIFLLTHMILSQTINHPAERILGFFERSVFFFGTPEATMMQRQAQIPTWILNI